MLGARRGTEEERAEEAERREEELQILQGGAVPGPGAALRRPIWSTPSCRSSCTPTQVRQSSASRSVR